VSAKALWVRTKDAARRPVMCRSGSRNKITQLCLVQILLPAFQATGKHHSKARFEQTRKEVTKKFGGLTSYSRAPAKGFWKKGPSTERDDIIVLEVMVPRIERQWWKRYRQRLEKRFEQEEIIIRSISIRSL